MNIKKELFVRLPVYFQDFLMERLFKSGQIFTNSLFHMLLHSFEFFGGDLEELKEVCTSKENAKLSLLSICRKLGESVQKTARIKELEGNIAEARILYQRASIYYLLGDWYTYDRNEIAFNYSLMLPCYDKVRMLSSPHIEKIDLPFDIGSLKAHIRIPKHGTPPYPAIVIVQGNDEVKEFNSRFEEMALERGLATFTLDPPGWGESGISGNRFSSAETYRKAMTLTIDFLQNTDTICPHAIGIFGVSFGGTLSLFAAGLEKRFKAAAGMGGPIIDLNHVRRHIPKAQANRAFLYTGTKNMKELEEWTDKIDFCSHISKVKIPVLIIHGENDDLVSTAHAKKLCDLVQGEKQLRIIPKGDHMCTHALESEVGPSMFDFLASELTKLL